jgi:hypothetical protein
LFLPENHCRREQAPTVSKENASNEPEEVLGKEADAIMGE